MSADGRRFLIDGRAPGPPEAITVVVNWTAGLLPGDAEALAAGRRGAPAFAMVR